MHIRADVHIDTNKKDGCDAILPEEEDWFWRMRAAWEDDEGFTIRLDNYPLDGSVERVALSVGPYSFCSDEAPKYLECGPVPGGFVFALLLDAPKLDELIAALQLVRANFPPPGPPPRRAEEEGDDHG